MRNLEEIDEPDNNVVVSEKKALSGRRRDIEISKRDERLQERETRIIQRLDGLEKRIDGRNELLERITSRKSDRILLQTLLLNSTRYRYVFYCLLSIVIEVHVRQKISPENKGAHREVCRGVHASLGWMVKGQREPSICEPDYAPN